MAQGFTKDYLVKATGETKVSVNGVKQNSTSGSDIDFTIPSGVKEVVLTYAGVSNSAGADILGRIGSSGSVETTGYIGGGNVANSASSIAVVETGGVRIGHSMAAGSVMSGVCIFRLHDAATNTWCWNNNTADSGDTNATASAGYISLSGELDIVSLHSPSGTYDAGSVNISYENPDLAVSYNGTVAAGVTDVFVNGTKQASTSGSSIDFTGIPSGVKEFKVCFSEVSLSGTEHLLIQLGDAGGIEDTGYLGTATNASTGVSSEGNTTGVEVYTVVAADTINGVVTFVLMDEATNLWACSGIVGVSSATKRTMTTAFSKALSGELTQIRIKTESANTFDSGSVNIQYDNQELDLGSRVLSGAVVQTVHTQDGETANGTTAIAADDTIPQNTEGDEYMTASITPTNVANKLKVEVVLFASTAVSRWCTTALFQDSTAAALACGAVYNETGTALVQVVFTHWMDAGTTDSTTFKVRAGSSSTDGLFFNGYTGPNRYFGGAMASSITITEYAA